MISVRSGRNKENQKSGKPKIGLPLSWDNLVPTQILLRKSSARLRDCESH
jgi:hypothetical protein